MDSTKMTSEVEGLKNKLRAVWTAGDFAEIATAIEAGAEEFVERLNLKEGTNVLDVACGNGNTALPAAAAGAEVTGVDLAPYLIDQAIERAAAAGLAVEFDVGDVEALPYDDASFDIVLTMFGAMFAPRPELTVAELKRVCRSGGLIAMANWTPEGFVGQMFKTTGKHVPPPAGVPSPLLWGNEDSIRQRFADGVTGIQMTRRNIDFVFRLTPSEVVEHFRKYYGPTQKAFESLDAEGQAALRKDLEDLWSRHNSAVDGTTRVSAEYMEVRVTKS